VKEHEQILALKVKGQGQICPLLFHLCHRNLITSRECDYCDVLMWPDAYERRHEWWTACKHSFM